MNPFGGLVAVFVVYLVWPAVRDWWCRRDRVVDVRFADCCEALRGVRDGVDLPPFRIVVPDPYDWQREESA